MNKLLVGLCATATVLVGMFLPQLTLAKEKAEVFVQQGHLSGGISVAISPDGKSMISGSADKTLKLWDLESQREIRTFKGHSDPVNSVAFSPSGKYVISGSDDKTLRLWNVGNGHVIRIFKGHSDPVNSVAFSPSGKYVISGSNDKTLRLWNVENGHVIRIFKGHSGYVRSVAFSPSGKYVISGSWDGTIKLWNVENGHAIRTFEGDSSNVYSVAFSPSGKYVISGNGDHTVKLWDIESGRNIRTFKGHSSQVNSVAFSPSGKYVISGSWDRTIKLWNVEQGKEVRSFEGGYLNSLVFSRDGKWIISGSNDKSIWMWPIKKGKGKIFTGYSIEVDSVAYSPDNKMIVSGEKNRSVNLWNMVKGRQIRSFKGYSFRGGSVAVFSPDGKSILSGSIGHTLKLWNTETGGETRIYEGHSDIVSSVAFSPDGKRAISGSFDNTLKLWNVETGGEIRTFKGHSNSVTSVAFSPDGKYVISGSFDHTIKLWNINTSQEIRTFKNNNNTGLLAGVVTSIAFSPHGKRIISGDWGGSLKLWDVENGREIRIFKGHDSLVASIAFSSDGKQIISGSWDGTLKLWDVESGREIRTFKGHLASVTSVALSSNHQLISSGQDGIRVWNLRSSKELVHMISFSDGEWIAITPEGYYNSSPNGHKYLNVRMGNKVYGIDQFYDVFYRPDIVRAKLAGEDISDLITLTIDEAIKNPPPEVKIGKVPVRSAKEKVKLAYNVESTGGGIGEVRVFHNGKLVKSDGTIRRASKAMLGQSAKTMNSDKITRQLRGAVALIDMDSSQEETGKSLIVAKTKKSPFASSVEIEPVPGENEVSIIAFNAQNSVQSLMRTIRFTSTRKPVPPQLHILAIGIDKYIDQLSTLKFAAKDARNMAEQLKLKAEALYGKGNVFMQTLYDEQATRSGILAKLKSMESMIKGTDHFILFVASHGVLLGDQYYMVTHDYDGSLQSDQLISSNEFVELSKSIRALSQLYILDTCHAGGMDSIIAGLYDARMSVLAKKMGLHIFASANSFEEALDGYHGNGLFTHNLLDGLNNNAKVDVNKDKSVSMVELGYFSRDKTRNISKQLGQTQEPLIINFGQDRPLYQLH